MRRFCIGGAALVLAGVVFAGGCGQRHDDAPVPPMGNGPELDWKLVKEPAYQSKAPGYCRLTFGAHAECHVWLVFDSVPDPLQPGKAKDYLYVDRNGNGDLTDVGERIEAVVHQRTIGSFLGGVQSSTVPLLEFAVGDITDKKGNTHKNLKVEVAWFKGKQRPCTISATAAGQWPQRAELQEVVFAAKPADAPLLRFGGPLTMRFALGVVHALSLSEATELSAEIGTPGTGAGTFVSLDNLTFPKDLHPLAKVEFPHRDPGKPPIEVTVVLKERC